MDGQETGRKQPGSWVSTNVTLLRVGIVLALAHIGLHDLKRHLGPLPREFGWWPLVLVTVLGVAAVSLIVVGWRRLRARDIQISRMEKALVVVVLAVSTMMVVGDLAMTFWCRHMLNKMGPP